MVNFTELREYDIKSIIQSTDNSELIILQQFASICSKMRASLSESLEDYNKRQKEFNKEAKENKHSISVLNDEITQAKKQLDTLILNQKVGDKEISNAIKYRETLCENLKNIRENRDFLALEIVDLEREMEERKKEKIAGWDAIKRACSVYKEKLDMRLKLDTQNDAEKVTVTFFVKKADNQYYVDLTYKNKLWIVDKIEPHLKAKHRKKLNELVNFSTDNQIENITSFLCQLRNIFLKYYFQD